MRVLLLCLALASCSAYDASLLPLPGCLWLGVGSVTTQPGADCYRVTAPEHARVSPVPIDECEAEGYGLPSVTVVAGETVWLYSEPNLAGAGVFKTKEVTCGE